jgi:hypothetical protein
MPRPRLFVGSSGEAQRIADAVQVNLQRDFEVTVWDQALFTLTRSTLEGLVRLTRESDMAVMVFFTDDVIRMRGKESAATRDNVVFELGLFLGALGTDNVFVLAPIDAELHLPTDLAGITVGRYDAARRDKNWVAALRPACNQIIDTVRETAPSRRARVDPVDEIGIADVVDYFEKQLSVSERHALVRLCDDGSLKYDEATKDKVKMLRNYGFARTATGKAIRKDNELVPTPFGRFVVRALSARAADAGESGGDAP